MGLARNLGDAYLGVLLAMVLVTLAELICARRTRRFDEWLAPLSGVLVLLLLSVTVVAVTVRVDDAVSVASLLQLMLLLSGSLGLVFGLLAAGRVWTERRACLWLLTGLRAAALAWLLAVLSRELLYAARMLERLSA